MSKPTFSRKRKGKKTDPYPIGKRGKGRTTQTKKGSGRPRKPRGNPPGVKRNRYDYDKAEKINVMKAKRGTVEQLDTGLWVEPKWDGGRGLGIVTPDRIVLRGASWITDFAPRYPEISSDLQEVNATRVVLDGELVFIDSSGKDVFLTGLAGKDTAKERGLKMIYMVYDIIFLEDKDLSDLPYRERRRILREVVPDLEHVKISPIIKKNQVQYWNEVVEQGREGLMMKDPDSPYTFKRSSTWKKLKLMYTEGAEMYDAVIIGYNPGKGKYENQVGALLLAQRSGNDWLYIGKTSGMDDDTRLWFTKELDAKQVSKSKMPPIVDINGKELALSKAKVFVKPKSVVEVKAASRTEGGRLRWSSFQRMRPDKEPNDATTELRAKPGTKTKKKKSRKSRKSRSDPQSQGRASGLTKQDKKRRRRERRRAAKKGVDLPDDVTFYFHRKSQVYFAYRMDKDGNQIGDAQHGATLAEAVRSLEGK